MRLIRSATAEFVGTAFLVAAIIGSGIAAERLSPDDVGLQLLENSLATGAVLVALILALQPVSAAFIPIVTLVERSLGVVTSREAAVLVGAQIVGGGLGAVVEPDVRPVRDHALDQGPHRHRGRGRRNTGAGAVIFGTIRSGRPQMVAFAVGGYITAGYWFTSSTSFANPAVTFGRMFSDTFAGIEPGAVPVFVLMQLVGGLLAYGLVRLLYPDAARAVAELTTREDR